MHKCRCTAARLNPCACSQQPAIHRAAVKAITARKTFHRKAGPLNFDFHQAPTKLLWAVVCLTLQWRQ